MPKGVILYQLIVADCKLKDNTSLFLDRRSISTATTKLYVTKDQKLIVAHLIGAIYFCPLLIKNYQNVKNQSILVVNNNRFLHFKDILSDIKIYYKINDEDTQHYLSSNVWLIVIFVFTKNS